MRKLLIFMGILSIFCGFWGVSGAQADPKPWPLSWWPGHFSKLDWERRYIEDSKIPHQALYKDQKWSPQDWTKAKGSAEEVIGGFYSANIITDQYDDDDVPVLEVGPGFMSLSGQDRRRVAAYVDSAYGITRGGGVFYLYHHKTGNPIGMYTQRGLQLQ